VLRAEVHQDVGGLPDQQVTRLQHRRRERGMFIPLAIQRGHHLRHAAALPRHVHVRHASLLQRQPDEFTAPLQAGPVK
jgi:hypothetical protein